jgi:RNA polymerase sigma-70 factor (ECF subfamily)
VIVNERQRRFETLYLTYYGHLMRYAARRVEDGQQADVVAETFTIAWRRLDQLRGDDPLPWLYGIARRVLANDRRARFRRLRLAERITAQAAAPASDHAEDVAARVSLAAMIDALPEGDRECLRLAEWEQLTPCAAAAVMGCSVTTYKVRLHRARRRLAALLARQTHVGDDQDAATSQHQSIQAVRCER